jgi:glycerol uptake facilitator protein
MEFSLPQRAFAEALGTALLVLVGPGSVVAVLTLAGKSTPAVTGADLLGISFAFGLIITALVYALGKVSGCHINPAVTFGLAATKRFPWREVPAYWAGQVIGAVLGALAIWGIVDKRSPGDFAGLVIGGVVIAIIMVIGPITGASLNPARAFGPEFVSSLKSGATHWNQLLPVYILPGLIGSALAAFVYDFVAHPRRVARPISEAVTHPDPGPAVPAK